jgi:regulatory protein
MNGSPRKSLADPSDRELMRAAIAMLARRDFSRAELRRRLLRKAGEDASASQIDRILDDVQSKGLQSEHRFAQEFVRARQGRFGPVRLRHELQRRGVEASLVDDAIRAHQADEFAAALTLWARRFAQPAQDAPQRARQSRFLAARGFSHDVIRRVLAHRP